MLPLHSLIDEFGDDCTVFWKYLDEGDRIYVEYKGKGVASFCNDYSFKGRGDEILDEYEVCVTPLNFTDPNCAVRLDYKDSYGGRLLKVMIINVCSFIDLFYICIYLFVCFILSRTRNFSAIWLLLPLPVTRLQI
jgi:hypothetical protein